VRILTLIGGQSLSLWLYPRYSSLWVNPPTSLPCSQGHCWNWHHEAESLMKDFAVICSWRVNDWLSSFGITNQTY